MPARGLVSLRLGVPATILNMRLLNLTLGGPVLRIIRQSAVALFAVVVLTNSGLNAAAASAPPESFANLAEKLSPAVVNISTTYYRGGERDENTGPGDAPWEDWFREFFERRRIPDGENNRPRRRRQTSLGSGFIIDKAGYVVTNNHVIEDADEISVILADDTVLDAKIVGRDERVDVALLKIEAKDDLPTLKWGDSNVARVGDWVVAIGNPFGLSGTVTAGIISARARNISVGNYDDYIQTDAAINRGNSGGPLLNMDGQVIGVNTAIFSPSGSSVGVGFAASSSLIRPIINDLRKYGRTRRGWIGVQIQSVSEEIALSLGLDRARGALISHVVKDSPALGAGIAASDIILSFNGKSIDKMQELPRVVAETSIDSIVEVEIWHEGQRKTVKMKVGELDAGADQAVASINPSEPQKPAAPERIELADLGFTVVEITDLMREKLSLPPTMRGLVVVEIDDFSDAAFKGLRKGDVIDEIHQMKVRNIADARVAIQMAKDTERNIVLVRITTNGTIRYVPVKMAG